MWKRYEVVWEFENKLCGSVPQNPEMINNWLSNRTPTARPPGSKSIAEISEEVMGTIATQETDEELKKAITLGFQNVNGILCMRGGTIKAHMKDCSRIISSLYVGKIAGERSFAVKIINCVMVEEYWLKIFKKNVPVTEADGLFEKSVHVQTSMGPRNALKIISYIMNPTITFTLKVMENTHDKTVISMNDLSKLFEYGGVHGYAGERGDGEGRYTFKIKELKNG